VVEETGFLLIEGEWGETVGDIQNRVEGRVTECAHVSDNDWSSARAN
jgi:hypothetical protein